MRSPDLIALQRAAQDCGEPGTDRPWTWADIAFFSVASFISGGIAMAWFLQPAIGSFQ